MKPQLTLRLLGAPEVILNGICVTGNLLNKAQAIVVYLAVTGQPAPRTTLSVLLWGDMPESSARANLRKALANLRAVIGPAVTIDRRNVVLSTDATVAVDASEFSDLMGGGLKQKRHADIETALTLYRGDFLHGFHVRNAQDFDRWMWTEQERLRQLAIDGCHALIDHELAGAAYERAISYARRLLAMESWNEEAHRKLILALSASGQRTAALVQYERCVEILSEELGAEPGGALRQLYEKILEDENDLALAPVQPAPLRAATDGSTAEMSSARGPLRHVPSQLRTLIGREDDLHQVLAMLANPDCRLLTIVGPGGIGKTSLAVATAYEIDDFADGVCFVSLDGVKRAEDLSRLLLNALPNPGRKETTSDDFIQSLQHTDAQLLLILDNFEQLLPDGNALVEELLVRAPGVKLLVTSRASLNLRWEWRHDLRELRYPSVVDRDVRSYSAVQLFIRLAERSRPSDVFSDRELADIVEICRLMGGMPLGIELAAAQVGRLSCAAIRRGLEQNLNALPSVVHDLPPRQQSLQAAFDYSWSTLTKEEQLAFAGLCVFPSGFTIAAAEAVANASLALLIRLLEKSLVRQTSDDRYRIHEVLRYFGKEKLWAWPAERDTAVERFQRYYRSFLRKRSEGMKSAADPANHLSLLDVEMQNAWAAWQLSLETGGDRDLAIALDNSNWLMRWSAFMASPDTTVSLAQQRHWLEAQSDRLNVCILDVIAVDMLKEHLIDLDDDFGEEVREHIPPLAERGVVDGRLVALPYHCNVGLLYSRMDLLQKYGFDAPPQTWEALEAMAEVVQAGERAEGRDAFWGYIWQGKNYEGLTCNALEWQASHGGGAILDANGNVTVNNPQAIAAFERAARWVGAIAPPNVLEFDETTSQSLWNAGNALFLRSWVAEFGHARQNAPSGDAVVVTRLPSGGAGSYATLGGAMIAISRYTKFREASIALIKESNTADVQRRHMLGQPAHAPTLRSLYNDSELLAQRPVMQAIKDILREGLVARPARGIGLKYLELSRLYASAVHSILARRLPAAQAVETLEQDLTSLLSE